MINQKQAAYRVWEGENMLDLAEVWLICFELIRCKISVTKSSFGQEIKKKLWCYLKRVFLTVFPEI